MVEATIMGTREVVLGEEASMVVEDGRIQGSP